MLLWRGNSSSEDTESGAQPTGQMKVLSHDSQHCKTSNGFGLKLPKADAGQVRTVKRLFQHQALPKENTWKGTIMNQKKFRLFHTILQKVNVLQLSSTLKQNFFPYIADGMLIKTLSVTPTRFRFFIMVWRSATHSQTLPWQKKALL